jgi:transposase
MLIKGQDRNQIQLLCLDSAVDEQSTVRIVDAFVDTLDLAQLGFEIKGKINNGAPAYQCHHLLKLYYYGYLNRVRSSRRLEREAKTNIEAMWLIKCVQPSYKTIANFRKDNKKALGKVFYELNKFLKAQGLFDEEKICIDGSKFRAQNSKKNNYNEKKVDQHLDYINKQTQQYLDELDLIDQQEDTETKLEQTLEISNKLDQLKKRKDKYTLLHQEVELAREKGETQISTTDAEARALPKKMNIVEMSYNVITAAEMKNKLITNFEVSNKLDTYGLSPLAIEARKVLGKQVGEKLIALADKGFDTGSELKICTENDIETYVACKNRTNTKQDKQFNKDQFDYDLETDTYTCPEDQILKSNQKWYNKTNGKHRRPMKSKHYKAPFKICKDCPHKLKCVGESNLKNSKGRCISRSEYQEYIDDNIERVKLNKALYRQRQQVIEHPFGTIKRQWGYDYTLLKGMEKVTAEFAIIFTAYNLRRAISILGAKVLISRLYKRFEAILVTWCFRKQQISLCFDIHHAVSY